jgi:hypothetical protein
MESAMKCRKCRISEVEQSAKGRPKEYCSTACRRAAEFEIRRLDRRLGKLEDRDSELRDPSQAWLTQPAQRKKNLAFVTAEIESVRGRMHVLLSDHVDDESHA